ncbi:hypothetical protein COW36_01995 [bacterium (Candidatus Blackallbacteria) CG17_big_fil_post_rev_8_21_14_2_50_48_46]|uniref:Flagellar motor switch protein FliG n=1 Tax=bacterium (Candidatus Blackallbacteria) CG17_big_fil_post_rev_8_21_14_2_50_48_46 TaxID=2014261 RepID=A0A2M7GAM3_9BACT|nr:MAG: hypothetical protein COW64_26385 [bacterium (Candidatus Blackallbacteria) CG18_big_fil_WC_8_21_14_2_50_49_26]PIW19206.1 MAG: hypothetical protein COW36_01995 [bacterium (Candidatus Blackallbacteria) CG17_big_fil_post_rev_8_21_14_2_50_48_46]PIW45444.1 MAG: hypothetical protein COW20_20145 [bacterium (Candidatus Blackallbacteria) CG13_big_fil_rev_8_21_14_2_50_49_14]
MNWDSFHHWLETHSLLELFESGFLSRCLTQELSSAEKAAVFLRAVGQATAAPILARLKSAEVEKIIQALKTQGDLDPALRLAVLDELEHSVHNPLIQGGKQIAREMLDLSFTPGKAEDILKKIQTPALPYFHWMHKISNQDLLELLEPESITLQAAVLVCLRPEQAASFLSQQLPKIQEALALQIAQKHPLNQEILEILDQTLLQKYQKRSQTVAIQGRKTLAKSLGHLNINRRERVLESLGDIAPELEHRIREEMLSLEDLNSFSGPAFSQLLAGMDDQCLAWSLKLATPKLQLKLLSHLSQRRADMVQEYKASLPPRKRSEAEKHMRRLLEAVLEFQRQGRLPHHTMKEEPWID